MKSSCFNFFCAGHLIVWSHFHISNPLQEVFDELRPYLVFTSSRSKISLSLFKRKLIFKLFSRGLSFYPISIGDLTTVSRSSFFVDKGCLAFDVWFLLLGRFQTRTSLLVFFFFFFAVLSMTSWNKHPCLYTYYLLPNTYHPPLTAHSTIWGLAVGVFSQGHNDEMPSAGIELASCRTIARQFRGYGFRVPHQACFWNN